LHPELETATGKSEEDIQALVQALHEAWNALDSKLFKSLVESMERRVKTCYKAKG